MNIKEFMQFNIAHRADILASITYQLGNLLIDNKNLKLENILTYKMKSCFNIYKQDYDFNITNLYTYELKVTITDEFENVIKNIFKEDKDKICLITKKLMYEDEYEILENLAKHLNRNYSDEYCINDITNLYKSLYDDITILDTKIDINYLCK